MSEFLAIAAVPEDPWEQLRMSVQAVFDSWNTPRAVRDGMVVCHCVCVCDYVIVYVTVCDCV